MPDQNASGAKENPHKPPVPSLFITNTRLFPNKIDKLKLSLSSRTQIQDSCVMIITETCLKLKVLDTAIELTGYITHCSDCNNNSGQSRRGGLCIYINKHRCPNTAIIDKHCSPDLECVTILPALGVFCFDCNSCIFSTNN